MVSLLIIVCMLNLAAIKTSLDKYFNIVIYQLLYRKTIFYSFAPCQSVATIHFEKAEKEIAQ